MKAPNLTSMIAIMGVLMPAIIAVITQEFPAEVYWWSASLVTLIVAAFKAFQVYAESQKAPEPQVLPAPDGALMDMGPMGGPPRDVEQPKKTSVMKSFLVG